MLSRLQDKIRQEIREFRASWHWLAISLILGFIGATVFVHYRLPLPWVLGAMATCTVATIAGVRIWIPRWLQFPMTLILGLLFGTTIAPNIFGRVIEWLPSVLSVFVFVLATTAASMLYLTRVMKTDFITAYFSSSPGGVIPMTAMGTHYGGEMRVIAMVQSMRMIVTVAVLPVAFALFAGYHPTGSAGTGHTMAELTVGDVPILIALALCGWAFAKFARLPAPDLLGPLLAMGLFHSTGVYGAPIPDPLVAFAQLTTGARLSSGFYRLSLRTFGKQLLHATTVALIMLAMGAAFALGLGPFSPFPMTALMLAYAPGGIAEMSLIAYGLGIEVVFVITHQLIRFFFVVGLVPLAVWVFKMKPKGE